MCETRQQEKHRPETDKLGDCGRSAEGIGEASWGPRKQAGAEREYFQEFVLDGQACELIIDYC